MSQQNQTNLEQKLEKYEALKQKIAHSIERVVNKEIIDKSKANITQTLEGVRIIRKNFQSEFRHLTVELHKDLLTHFENMQLTHSDFNQTHEHYLKFIEKLEEKHSAMNSECDEIVARIEEIYKRKIDELKETERQLVESRQQLSQQEQLSERKSPEASSSDRQLESPVSDHPIASKEPSSHKHHLQPSQSNQSTQSKSGLLGKVKNLLGGKNKEGAEPIPEMKLGEPAKFKWDPVKKKYIFEGEEEEPEEDVPMPPKMLNENKKKEETPKEQQEQQEKTQFGKSDLLKPHTSNLGFMRKKQAPSGGAKQPGGMIKPMNVFAPNTSSPQDIYNSEPTSAVNKQEKPLCVKMFEDVEMLLSGLSIGHIPSSSYLQPLDEIVALAKDDAEHLSDNQSEIDTYKQELEKAYQLIRTYETLSAAKDEAIGIVMQSEKQTNQQLLSVRVENEALQSSVDFYKDLLDTKTISTTDEDGNEKSIGNEGHFTALLNELSLQERITHLTDEVNALRLRETELETKCKLAEARAEMYRTRMGEEQEREFQQIYALFEDKSGKEDLALKFMTKSYELGQKLEARGKKIRALNGLCKQISDEVHEKNNQISELSNKLKRLGDRVEEKEAEIQSRDERIHNLENELALAAKDKKLINSLQLENNTLQKSLEHSKKEFSTTNENLNNALNQAKSSIEQLEKRLEVERKHKEELRNKLEDQSSRVVDLTTLAELGNHFGKIASMLHVTLPNHLKLEGAAPEVVQNIKLVLEELSETGEFTLRKQEIEKESLLQEAEILKTAYYHEREAAEQAQHALSEEIKDLRRELANERETVGCIAKQSSQLKADYDLILSKYNELIETNIILENKNQELLEKLSENLKQQLKFTQKYKLVRDGFFKQRHVFESFATQFQQVHEAQASYNELKNYCNELQNSQAEFQNAFEELRDSYDETVSAYEELRKLYHELKGEYDAHHSSSQSLKVAYDELRSAYEETQATYNTLKEAYEEVSQSLDQTRSSYEGMKGAYDELGNEYKQLRQAYDQLRQSYDELLKTHQNLKQSVDYQSKKENSETSALQINSQYESLRAEYEQLKSSFQQLEETCKELQDSNERLLQDKDAIEVNLKAENQSLLAKIQELEASVEILSQQREKTNEEAFQETMSQLVNERTRADNLNQQLETVLADLTAAGTSNENLKRELESQIENLKRENELLLEEVTTLKAQGTLKEAQPDVGSTNVESLKAQNVQLQNELKLERENSESLENALNNIQGEYEQLKTRFDASPRKIGDSKFPEHVLEALIQSYKEHINDELPMDQGDLVLKLLEKLNNFKSLHTNIQEKDVEIQNLSSRFEELQNENNRLLDTITLLESERNESEEVMNLKSLLEKKSKRLDELNKIIDDKNRELEKLREVVATSALRKDSQTHDNVKEEVSKETENLKKEIAELKEQNKKKTKELEDQTENLGFAEQRLKLLKEELDIFKLSHAEEIEALNKEINKKTEAETLLKKQLLDMKSLEPNVQVIEKKLLTDPKVQPVQTKSPEESSVKKNEKTPTTSPDKLSPEATKAGNESAKKPEQSETKLEEQKKGGFLTSMASFFLTDNEKKKMIKE